MRAQPSGLVVTVALAHDYVLRRNLRIATNSKRPTEFVQSAHGSHHVQFVSDLAKLWNELASKEKGKKPKPLPVLPIVASDETFGLVQSKYSSLFRGLLEVKDEIDGEDIDLALLDEQMDAEDVGMMLKRLQIAPSELDQPQTITTGAVSAITHLSSAVATAQPPADRNRILGDGGNHLPPIERVPGRSSVALGKRKELESNVVVVDSDLEEVEILEVGRSSEDKGGRQAKKMRLDAVSAIISNVKQAQLLTSHIPVKYPRHVKPNRTSVGQRRCL